MIAISGRLRTINAAAVLLIAGVLVAGCASTAAPLATVTVMATPTAVSSTQRSPETAAPATVTVTATASVEAPASTPVPVAAPATVTADTSAIAAVVMPDVTCMNLQAAQNAIQAAGVFYSRSDDATGAGRNQLVDSNWIVVRQSPRAGTPIGEGDAMLSAVKIGEPGDCS